MKKMNEGGEAEQKGRSAGEIYSDDKSKPRPPEDDAGERYSTHIPPAPDVTPASLRQPSLPLSQSLQRASVATGGQVNPITESDAAPTMRPQRLTIALPRHLFGIIGIATVMIVIFSALLIVYHQIQQQTQQASLAATSTAAIRETASGYAALGTQVFQTVIAANAMATQSVHATATQAAKATTQPYSIAIPGACSDQAHWTDQYNPQCVSDGLEMKAIFKPNSQPAYPETTFSFGQSATMHHYAISFTIFAMQSQATASDAQSVACADVYINAAYGGDFRFCQDGSWFVNFASGNQGSSGSFGQSGLSAYVIKAIYDGQHVSFSVNNTLVQSITSIHVLVTYSISLQLNPLVAFTGTSGNFTSTSTAEFKDFTYTPLP